jgi:hypothetical protein
MDPVAANPAGPTRLEVVADWDDLDAAMVVAAANNQCAILGVRRPGPDEVEFEVRTIRDEPVTVSARRLGAADNPPRAEPIELVCEYGRFGDAAQQERILEAMRERLADLRGVDYRKVR